jgi:long-chain acyl-CoA synthetase
VTWLDPPASGADASAPGALALDDLERTRTRVEMAERVARATHALRDELGLAPDDHVAQLAGNRVELVELCLGALVAGVWMTPINWHLAPDEIAYQLDDSGAQVLFVDPEHRELAERAVDDRRITVIEIGDELDDLLARQSDAPPTLDGPPGGNMFYTSGTTGQPKGVKRARPPTVAASLAGLRSSGAVLGLDGRGPHLVTGPLYHAAPLGFAVMDLLAGAPLVLTARFDTSEVLELITSRQVRNSHLVPTMCVRLLALSDDERTAFDPSSLRTVLHGAAPIAESVKRRMIEWWGPVFVEYWGGSEGGVVTLIDSEDWLRHPGSVGRPTPGHEVVADDEGVLWCRKGDARLFEYHGAPEKTDAAHAADGAYSLGDIGSVDDEGYVYLSDRKSNMIISGGVNVYPAEVEVVLIDHPAVRDVAVFGIPDDEWGESVKGAVELADGYVASADLERDILAFGAEQLAKFKVPRSLDFEDALPRHDTGKLYTRLLKARYWPDSG